MKNICTLLLIPLAVGAVGGCKPSLAPDGDERIDVEIHLIDASGMRESVGTIRLADSADGLRIDPRLSGLPPGDHGFHFHQNPDCGPAQKDGRLVAGEAAGEHFDPTGTGRHAGPAGSGHAGDLPMLAVTANGNADVALFAPRLALADVRRRALVIHADSDDYAGAPGGARIACGVVS